MVLDLDKSAHALRPVRMREKQNDFVYYTGTTFPDGPWQGCELYLRRCCAFGYLKDEGTLTIDVLNENGDIVQEFPITRKGFEYLRRVLKFRVEKES